MRLLLFFFMVLLFTSCLSTKRINRFINQKNENINYDSILYRDYIIINADKLAKLDTFVESKKIRSLFVPAVIYWQWDNKIESNLNPVFPLNIFKSILISHLDSINYRENNNQKIELIVNNIPSVISYSHKGFLFLILWPIGYMYSNSDHEDIGTLTNELNIDYRIIEDNREINKGNIKIELDNVPFKYDGFKKEYISIYLDQYIIKIKDMSNKFTDKLLEEL